MTSSLTSSSLRVCALGVGASLLIACGGAQDSKPAGPATPAAPATEDVTISAREPTVLTAVVIVPELTRPALEFAQMKKKPTLEKQRATFQKAKAEQKQAEAQILVTLIYTSLRDVKNAGESQALVEEARNALKEARNAAGDKVTLTTLRNLASLLLGAGDFAGAGEVYKDALTRFPEGEHVVALKGWLAYTQLRQNQNAEALATLQGVAPAPEQPEAAYTLAWARWRAGDAPGAVEAIKVASKGWKPGANRNIVDRDSGMMLARGGASVEDAVKSVVDATQNQRDATYVGLFRLHQSFVAAGRFLDAVVILDRAAARVGDKIPVQDQAKFYLQQADYTLRAGVRPDEVVTYQKKALETYATCADKCTREEHEGGAITTRNLATFFDTIYRTARDDRFYQPAAALYDAYLALPGRSDTADVKKFAEDLKAAQAAAEPGTGKHDPSFMLTLVNLHGQEIQACYERALISEPSLTGELTVTVEVTDKGEVKGVATEPAAGEAGLAKVAACSADKAKAWMFPSRTKPGTSRVVVKFQLALPAPTAPAAK